jgi:serpin B
MLQQFQQKAQPTRMELYLPKFEFTVEYQVADTLAKMGMPDAFCSGMPDFSGMVESSSNKGLEPTPLCIGGIFHKAFVKVDEKGTEAAAASAVVMQAMAIMGDQPVIVKVDHPFLFLIIDKKTGTILFMGRINNPKS